MITKSLTNLPTLVCVLTTASRMILLKARANATIIIATDVGPVLSVGINYS